MKKRWENLYKEFSSNEKKAKMSALKVKRDIEPLTVEEYKELERYERIEGKIEQVKNIIDLRGDLESQLTNIKEIKKDIENAQINKKKALENREKLETELAKIKTAEKEINEQLQNPDTADAKKDLLRNNLSVLKDRMDKNTFEYSKNEKELASAEEFLKTSDYKKCCINYNKIQAKISKCDLAAQYLLQGKSWEEIEQGFDRIDVQTLEKNKKYIVKKEDKTENKEEDIEPAKSELENETKQKDDVVITTEETGTSSKAEPIVKEDSEKEEYEEENKEDKQMVKAGFWSKHPRLKKIADGFLYVGKTIVNAGKSLINELNENDKDEKVKDEDNKETENTEKEEKVDIPSDLSDKIEENAMKEPEVENEKQQTEDKEQEAENEESKVENDNEFKKLLRVTAEKGYVDAMKEVHEEQKNEHDEALLKKFNDAKAEAIKRQAEKFGEDYSDKSGDKNEDKEHGKDLLKKIDDAKDAKRQEEDER